MTKEIKWWGLIGLAVFVVAASVVAYIYRVPLLQRTVDVNGKLTLDVADTPSARELGLGGRTSMAKDHGMMFVFEKSGIYPFWMKGMHFPLDIVWINQGIVQEVVKMNAPVNDKVFPDMHAPIHQADRVLEVNAGVAQELGIKPGVKVVGY
jgi:hypothetical protein